MSICRILVFFFYKGFLGKFYIRGDAVKIVNQAIQNSIRNNRLPNGTSPIFTP
jgi:hypothetical protein